MTADMLASEADTCGPPNGHPVPVVRSTPIPNLPASVVVHPSASIHSGDKNFKYRDSYPFAP
jgi:hypothetical protein